MSADLPCHLCGYDLRAHRQDAKCPECGAASVEESRRLAAIPRRPAWRDSDPRWRRRVLAGTWILVLLPFVVAALHPSGWAAGVRVPTLFDIPGSVRTLEYTFFFWPSVYQPLIFCTGVVLLFAKERGRRRSRSDRARPWGVACSYVVLLLGAAQVFFVTALVLLGVSALFLSMPAKYQPDSTQLLVDASAACLRYGPHPRAAAAVAQVGFSSLVILLACFRLFDALRSSGPKWLAAALLAPLALAALTHIAHAVNHGVRFAGATTANELFYYGVYFRPELLVEHVAGLPTRFMGASRPEPLAVFAEAAKWSAVLGVTVWMSIAQLAAWLRRGKTSAA